MGDGLVGPQRFPIRDPKTTAKRQGRMVNSPHYADMGGLTGPGKLPAGGDFVPEAPTGVKSAKKTSARSQEG